MLKLIMWQKTSFAGSGLVETFLKNQKLKKKQRQLVLAGALGLIVLQCHLHMGMMLDGNGLGILDEIVLVSGGSFYPMKFVGFLSLHWLLDVNIQQHIRYEAEELIMH